MMVIGVPSINTSKVILFYVGICALEKKFGLYLNWPFTWAVFHWKVIIWLQNYFPLDK